MAGAAERVVIRPRPTGVRLTLLRTRLSQPLVIVSLLVLAVGIGRAIVDRSFVPGTLTLVWLPILALAALAYLRLYYRNVSWGVVDEALVRTGVLLRTRRIPISPIRGFVRVRLASEDGSSEVVLVLGDQDRCLATIGRSDEFLGSDLEALARAARAALIDGGSVEPAELGRRYPGALSRPVSAVLAIRAWGRLGAILFGVAVAIAFLAYEVARVR
jgi:hypothetical protein